MTPHQKQELMTACESGNDVRIVTIALQVAATAAREHRQNDALAIRRMIDTTHSRDSADRVYRQMRLDVAKSLFTYNPDRSFEDNATCAVKAADALIKATAEIEVPK